MVVRNSTPSILYPSTPLSDSVPASPALSDCDADDEDMSAEESSIPSRPLSETVDDDGVVPGGGGPYCPRTPSLHDVLANSAPPPWTLSAFTAYLSQNHCLETLEFTMDAERYQRTYDQTAAQLAGQPMRPDSPEVDHMRRLWHRLIKAYITPNGPREVNLPCNVRDTLLSLPYHAIPPPAAELDVAVRSIYQLMDESVLMPFLNDVGSSRELAYHHHHHQELWPQDSDDHLEARMSLDETSSMSSGRSRSRRKGSPPIAALHLSAGLVGRGSGGGGRSSAHASMSSTGSGGDFSWAAMLTDDSGGATSPSPSSHHHHNKEPVTPPSTPPGSEFGSPSSSAGRGDGSGWKKMMGMLGNRKKSAGKMRRSEHEGEGLK